MLRLQLNPKTTEPKRTALEARMEEARRKALQLPPGTVGFGPLAIDYSDDDATRYRGGDLGWLDTDPARYHIDPAALATGFALEERGQISSVIRGKDALYLVRVIDRRPAHSVAPAPNIELERHRALLAKRRALESAFAEETRAEIPVRLNVAAVSAWKARQINTRDKSRILSTQTTALSTAAPSRADPE
jgi:peptidyl-prolyl cis-trans isomerase C